MRQPLIDHSEDLKRLAEDGYEVETWSGFLILKNIPYVATDRSVERGTLVSKLELAGDVTARPGDHVAYLIGGTPCDHTGQPLTQIIIDQNPTRLADGLEANCTFSSKPSAGYRDYYEKMNTYASIISSHARVLDRTPLLALFHWLNLPMRIPFSITLIPPPVAPNWGA